MNAAMGDASKSDIVSKFADIAAECVGIEADLVKEDVDDEWRRAWGWQKFALQSGAAGAPTHVIGETVVPDTSSSWSSYDWYEPLLAHAASLTPAKTSLELIEVETDSQETKCDKCIKRCAARWEKRGKDPSGCEQKCQNNGKCEKPALVSWQIFLDIQCPYSKRTWDNVPALRREYGNKFNITTHLYQLAFHYQSYTGHKAAASIAGSQGEKGKLEFIGCAYERQEEFMNAAMGDAKKSEIEAKFADIAAKCNKVDATEFVDTLGDAWRPAWNEQKFSMAAGAVVAPTHNIGGVVVPDTSSSWTAEEWLSPLIEHMEMNAGGW